MCFKNVLTCECVNALVSSRNANETSPWGDGNLADRGVIKIFFKFQKQLYFLHFEKMYFSELAPPYFSALRCALCSAGMRKLSMAFWMALRRTHSGRRPSCMYGSAADHCLASAVAKNHACIMRT